MARLPPHQAWLSPQSAGPPLQPTGLPLHQTEQLPQLSGQTEQHSLQQGLCLQHVQQPEVTVTPPIKTIINLKKN